FDFSVTANPGPGKTDLQSIMAHENGHWLGLDHSAVAQATMYAYYSGGTGPRTLHPDDETAVCDTYPGNCGALELCGNGVDDDDDGQADCADPDCTLFPGCSCTVDSEIGCDATLSTDNAGVASIDAYSCSEFPLTGPEAVYTFTPNEDGEVTVALTGLTADVDLIVTTESGGSCEPDNCLSSNNEGTADEVLVFNGSGGVTYTVVADGYDGAVADFTITTLCPRAEGGGPCVAELPPLTCGQSTVGSNFGFVNDVQAWGCVGWQTTGPEAVYELTPPEDSTVSLRLSGLARDLDLFVSEKVAGGCSEDACLAFSGNENDDDESLTFEAVGGTTYMVVVDGFSGNTSDFELDVRCTANGGPEDTGTPIDTCGCRTGSGPGGGVLFGLLALALRRRPTRTAARAPRG
ncbi:MAG: matrixin family metalloprotease, partial [Myxococcales bacterium]|nr:matrixin family metalloprotease [Myxococcales bacterium]